ncbi:ComEC/Rec2 family competence protein [Sorangium cellulosum]|uniref:ComEC/Rec2 family competence protein n=1 Tax=Sorangium cellulosum TaxID=56 RepID=UPI000B1AA7C4|nr:MBL fold metallo-hydrolase [Sorangium cellulosum]
MEAVEQLSLHLLDVGKGDAIVIDFPDGSFGLVDTGPSSRGEGVTEWLDQRAQRGKFRFAAITHWDTDHAAGMPGILRRYKPIRFYHPADELPLLEKLASSGDSTNPAALAEEIRRARDKDTIEACLFARDRLDTPEGVDLIALSPDSHVKDELYEAIRCGASWHQVRKLRNRLSVALWLRFAGVKLLLTGEVEAIQYKRMSDLFRAKNEPLHERYGSPQASWIKLSHHGAEGNNPPSLFQYFATQNVIASASAGGANGHPHPVVLHLVASRGGQAMCTRLGQGCGHIQRHQLDPNPMSWIANVSLKQLPNPQQRCYGDVSVKIVRDAAGSTTCQVRGSRTQANCPYGGPSDGEAKLIVTLRPRP